MKPIPPPAGEEVGPKLVRLLYFIGAAVLCTAGINKWNDLERKSMIQKSQQINGSSDEKASNAKKHVTVGKMYGDVNLRMERLAVIIEKRTSCPQDHKSLIEGSLVALQDHKELGGDDEAAARRSSWFHGGCCQVALRHS